MTFMVKYSDQTSASQRLCVESIVESVHVCHVTRFGRFLDEERPGELTRSVLGVPSGTIETFSTGGNRAVSDRTLAISSSSPMRSCARPSLPSLSRAASLNEASTSCRRPT